MTLTDLVNDILDHPGATIIAGAPEGMDGLVLADLARARINTQSPIALACIARDDHRMARLAEAIAFFAPEIEILRLPAWDCLPYDRISPNARISAARLAALAALAQKPGPGKSPVILLTTVNAALQRVPRAIDVLGAVRRIAPGDRIHMEELAGYFIANGFIRVSSARETGEFAVRGGMIDVFPPGVGIPVRLDFFGDTLDAIRGFDPDTQRTTGQLDATTLLPASEITLEPETIRRFRSGYTALFGAVIETDPLYEAISGGRRYQGMEHWLPLFHGELECLFDYLDDTPVCLDHLSLDAATSRFEQIADYYEARKTAPEHNMFATPAYKPLPPDALYLTPAEWQEKLGQRPTRQFSPFEEFDAPDRRVVSLGGRQGRSFAPEREQQGVNVFDALADHLRALGALGKRLMVCAWSKGSLSRLDGVLRDHNVTNIEIVEDWPHAERLAPGVIALAVFGLERGFESDKLALIGEQDILGDRLVRATGRAKKHADFIVELSALTPGDFIVHADHGIGRFEGLTTIDVQGAPHDCLHLSYLGGDRLFLPVENAELLSRYGGDQANVALDKLGGAAWQARKARLKKRIRDIAQKLIETAAARTLRKADVLSTPAGFYEEFSARFPYEETADQTTAIDAVLNDLASGQPMDRLICGDVGFGKTEVAMRSAFVAAMAGKQTAIIVPTTLLARQHFATFTQRFSGLPIKIAQMSRLISPKAMSMAKKGIASGDIDIVIGTHVLLGKAISFRDLGLLIIDEEQHFGVTHKEKFKALRAEVHVLTLTATPIPRTLQLALSGVRDLSLIATPPIDRLAVRTFITPFDPVVIREALLRELYRGGQSFYVCPRIEDLKDIGSFLSQQVPEVKVAIAHGRLPAGQLDDIMTAFYDGQYDVLLSTSIIESGLDIPTVNTLIMHRSDMFGLSQLYQLRGRVGRSKIRAYALFTVPADKTLTKTAQRRLKVLQSLDTLGAGFSLASHDLDIRGAGNLLGEEQSGHIREVGFELYQAMLEEAVAQLKDDAGTSPADEHWSPQIGLGVSVLIPEGYVGDLTLRLSLYRRLSGFETRQDIDAFGAELIDRFGPYPREVAHLLDVVTIKVLCRLAGIDTVDAGPKGALIGFRDNQVANPAGLIEFITERPQIARLRPDHKLVYRQDWSDSQTRIDRTLDLVTQLTRINCGDGATRRHVS